MGTRLFCSAVFVGLLIQVQSQICQAQGNLDQRQQAIATAILFARGSASDELRTIPSEQIVVDVSQLLGKSGQPDAEAISKQLRATVTMDAHGKCDQGLTGQRALYARARCATAAAVYYVEAGDLQITGNVAVISVHVLKRGDPYHPAKSTVQTGADYTGSMMHASYDIQLTHSASGWGSPRVMRVGAT